MASTHSLTAIFSDVANAIRAKKGTSVLLHPYDFADEISTIDTVSSYLNVSIGLVPPEDHSKLWIICDPEIGQAGLAYRECDISDVSGKLPAGGLSILGRGNFDFCIFGGGEFSVYAKISGVYEGNGIGEHDPAATYVNSAYWDAVSNKWVLLSGESVAEYDGIYYIFDNYEEVLNEYGITIAVND